MNDHVLKVLEKKEDQKFIKILDCFGKYRDQEVGFEGDRCRDDDIADAEKG